jgi:hypothetical protein
MDLSMPFRIFGRYGVVMSDLTKNAKMLLSAYCEDARNTFVLP